MSVLTLQRDRDVLQPVNGAKHRRNLERAHQPDAHIGRASAVISCPCTGFARPKAQELGQEMKHSRLAGPVRPDQRMNTATANPQIDTATQRTAIPWSIVGSRMKIIGHQISPDQPRARLASCVANPC